MLNHPTLDQLKSLKLGGMADAFVELQSNDAADDLGHAEWLALLLDRESANRNSKRLNTRLRTAKLRHVGASIEDVDYRTPRKLDKMLFQQLGMCKWIGEHPRLTRSYTSVNSILKNNIDHKAPDPATHGPAITHPNIRGAGYFH